MNLVLSVAKKELRGFFSSAVAFIFVGVFLVVTLATFFTYEQFFVRNLADIRPLFTWLPVFLIFLVSALSMGLWSDEHRQGTLEVLFTLPVEIRKLVLGKFLGGMGVITTALLLTLGVPITVSFMGDLDFGPVFGGYLATWLLAGAYLAIGLALSSVTKHQIVALLMTMLTLSGLYFLGSDTFTGFFGTRAAEILSAISISGRFDSIGRGVVELGDLVYFASVIGFALVLNPLKVLADVLPIAGSIVGFGTLLLAVVLTLVVVGILGVGTALNVLGRGRVPRPVEEVRTQGAAAELHRSGAPPGRHHERRARRRTHHL